MPTDTEMLDAIEAWIEDTTPLVRWSDGSWSFDVCGRWDGGYYATAREALAAYMEQWPESVAVKAMEAK